MSQNFDPSLMRKMHDTIMCLRADIERIDAEIQRINEALRYNAERTHYVDGVLLVVRNNMSHFNSQIDNFNTWIYNLGNVNSRLVSLENYLPVLQEVYAGRIAASSPDLETLGTLSTDKQNGENMILHRGPGVRMRIFDLDAGIPSGEENAGNAPSNGG